MREAQLDLFRRPGGSPAPPAASHADVVVVDGQPVSIRFERHPRARRYRLTWLRNGTARCTLPPRGSLAEARRFVERCHAWIAQRLKRDTPERDPHAPLAPGSLLWFRGTRVPVTLGTAGKTLAFGGEVLATSVRPDPSDLRPSAHSALRRFAAADLPPRVAGFADLHGFTVRRVSVRNQRSRWGSCSRLGTISLNWRLVQVPDPVRDYILLHELAHLRHLNHSARFWSEVARLCPGFTEAETWLRRHGREIL